jgi:hypothetical protein
MQYDNFIKPKSGDAAILKREERNRQNPPTKTTRKQALYRVDEIAGPNGMFPISKSSWWAGVKSGQYPQPVRLGPRTTAWRVEDLEQLAKHGIKAGPFVFEHSPYNGGQS